MSQSAFEVRLTSSLFVDPGGKVAFDQQTLFPAGIEYNDTTGIVTLNKTGQYSVKWWIATETTLKRSIAFELQLSPGGSTPCCSPIKTGQITGFAVIDVQTPGTELSLVNKSITNTMLSRKTETKGYLLITPIGEASSIRVYRGDLSTPGSSVQAPLGNGLFYRLEYKNSTESRLVLSPMNGATVYDYRRLCSYDGGYAYEGDYSDGATISTDVTKDSTVFINSREIHWVLIRVKNPISGLWSTYEVRFFISGGGARATLWVNVIEEEVSY